MSSDDREVVPFNLRCHFFFVGWVLSIHVCSHSQIERNSFHLWILGMSAPIFFVFVWQMKDAALEKWWTKSLSFWRSAQHISTARWTANVEWRIFRLVDYTFLVCHQTFLHLIIAQNVRIIFATAMLHLTRPRSFWMLYSGRAKKKKEDKMWILKLVFTIVGMLNDIEHVEWWMDEWMGLPWNDATQIYIYIYWRMMFAYMVFVYIHI